MGKQTVPKRSYDSSHRQAQADQTRRQILAAALRVFTQRGYTGATMQLIAAEAGVGLQTIYANFRNKPRVLVALFNVSSSTSGEENVPVPQRARPQAMASEPNQHRQLQMFAEVVADNMAGAAPVSEIMADAARTEPEVDKVLRRLNAQRLQHMTAAVEQIRAHGPFLGDMDTTTARDIVWTLTSTEVFLLLTRDRGWSKDQYAVWLAEALTSALLG